MDSTKRNLLKSAGLMVLAGAAPAALTARVAHARPQAVATMWVHGNSVQQEKTVAGMNMERYGWGTKIQMAAGNASNWFHIPLTTMFTPQVQDNLRYRLFQVYLLFRTDYATLTAIHVWDGAKKIAEFNGLQVVGDHSAGIEISNQYDVIPAALIRTGLGISFHVDFVSKYGSSFIVAAAGADFVAP